MDILLVIVLIALASNYIIHFVASHFRSVSTRYLWILFSIHYLLTFVYFISASFSASDSVAYYRVAENTEDWFNLFESGTKFISFIAYISVSYLNLSYYSAMLVFSFFGFLGILLLYLSAQENVTLPKIYLGFSLVELLFLLPNAHYWSSSIGKGSTIQFGIGLFIFGLSRFNRRLMFLALGSFFIFMVRPHIFFALGLSIALGILISTGGIRWYLKSFIFILSGILVYGLSDNVVEFAEVESMNIFDSDLLAHRVSELGKADTGVNIQNYNIFMKLFTFWFRPLFIDSSGFMGLIASVENILFLILFIRFVQLASVHFRFFNGWFRICLIFFVIGSIMLAQVSGNLGLAMRQKSQMMPILFILICKAFTYEYLLRLPSKFRLRGG